MKSKRGNDVAKNAFRRLIRSARMLSSVTRTVSSVRAASAPLHRLRNGTKTHLFLRLNSTSVSPQHVTTFPDPSRPDLYYHLLRPPTPVSTKLSSFALSFLESPPSKADSPSVIGWLPAESENGEQADAGLNDFRENGMSD